MLVIVVGKWRRLASASCVACQSDRAYARVEEKRFHSLHARVSLPPGGGCRSRRSG